MVPPVEGHGVRRVRGGLLLALAAGVAAAGQGEERPKGSAVIRFSNCLICHLQYEEQLGNGAHGEAGVVCESCHGESRGHLDDEHNNVKPDRVFTDETVAGLCAECHADSAATYALTAGKRRKDRAPACHICHGSHRVVSLDEAEQVARKLKIEAPHGRPRAVRIRSVVLARERVSQFEPLFINTVLDAPYENPFDPDDIQVEGRISAPGGQSLTVPCFYMGGPKARSHWQARFTPEEAGRHRGDINVEGAGRVTTSEPFSFEVVAGQRDGFLRLDPESRFSLKFAVGAPFRGLGVSLDCEMEARGGYGALFRSIRARGGNLVRLRIDSPDLRLERSGSAFGRYDLYAARRLDEVIDQAEPHGIYLLLVLDDSRSLEDGRADSGWSRNPYNAALGGPCERPAEVFTSEAARAAYRKRLRYIVARWGYSPHIAAWELWNGVGRTDAPRETIRAWHAEMAAYLKQIDPYQHLVTTSAANLRGLWSIPETDFSQSHLYGRTDDIADVILGFERRYGKPHVIGEFASRRRERTGPGSTELSGIDYRTALWAGLFSPTPILPLTRWRDCRGVRDGLPDFGPAARLCEEMLGEAPILPLPEDMAVSVLPPGSVEVLGCQTRDTIYLWMRNAAYSTPAMGLNGLPVPVNDAAVSLSSMAANTYRIDWYDTGVGRYRGPAEETSPERSVLRIRVPPLRTDIAARITAR